MKIFCDLSCCSYETPGHPERPFRVRASEAKLRQEHPDWKWPSFESADEKALLRAHSQAHLERLQEPRDFDLDTEYHEGIYELAKRSCGASLAAVDSALRGELAFSLMRPPGHHAEREQAMGFCYLSNAAIATLAARETGAERVALWDFDAHHGNGSQAILHGREGIRYLSVHQHPCYPGTGARTRDNCVNFPVPPFTPPERHLEILRNSWEDLLAFEPDLILVSAGFDAYERDPITEMTLRREDFVELGDWLSACSIPSAGFLEGGYSDDLPDLVDAFLSAWNSA